MAPQLRSLTCSLSYLLSVSLLFFIFHCLCFRFSFVAACSNSTEEQHHRHRKWVGPSGHKVITVSLNGHAQFRSVQGAVDSIPKNNNMSIVIKIAPGYYRYFNPSFSANSWLICCFSVLLHAHMQTSYKGWNLINFSLCTFLQRESGGSSYKTVHNV